MSQAFCERTAVARAPSLLWVDCVEKVESRSLLEIRRNDDAIFGLIWLPTQINYGRLGLTGPRIMRSPRVRLENQRLRCREHFAVPANRLFQQNRPIGDIAA